MNIVFQLVSDDRDELKIMDDFCNYLVREIKQRLLLEMPVDKLISKEKDILNASWIQWTKKPNHINVIKLVKLIINNIRYRKRKGHKYLIEINPNILLPRSKTPIEQVARFLDKGNNVTFGTTFLSRVFMIYRSSINNYWRSYASLRLRKITVSSMVVIK